MDEVQRRYEAATKYVRHAITTVKTASFDVADAYAAALKVAPFESDLHALSAKWLRATTETERNALVREAELLADRTKETLPGAPSDWKRTNLAAGEVEVQTAPTNLDGEMTAQAGEAWGWVKDKAGQAAGGIATIGKWFVVGGAVLLGLQLAGAFERAERRVTATRRNAGPTTICPVCHQVEAVDSDGLIALHKDPDGDICKGSAGRPLGSGQPKAKPTPLRRARR